MTPLMSLSPTICDGDTCADNNRCTADGQFANSDLNIPSSVIEDILSRIGLTFLLQSEPDVFFAYDYNL